MSYSVFGYSSPKSSSGTSGPKGPKGVRGDKGDKGDNGDKGDIGVKGDKGDKGEKGDRGDKGDTVPGPLGPPGPQGEKGEKGVQGLPGVKGEKGDVGLQGPAGPIGLAGKDLPRGFLMGSIRQALTIEDPSFNIQFAKTSISIGENAQLTESGEIEILKSGEYAISFIIGHQVLLQNIHCVLEYIVTTRSATADSNEIAQPVPRVSAKVSADSTSNDCYFQVCQAEHILKLDSGTTLQIVGKYRGTLSAVVIESAFVTVKAI